MNKFVGRCLLAVGCVAFASSLSAVELSKDQELQLKSAQCDVAGVKQLLSEGANPLAKMSEEGDYSFDMALRQLGIASKANNVELFQNCIVVTEKIRSYVNSGDYEVKIIKIQQVAETKPEVGEDGFSIGQHKFEVLGTFSYAYAKSDNADDSTNLSVGGEIIHTVGPWKNTFKVDLDNESVDGQDDRNSHIIFLESRRIIFDEYTVFAQVKDIENLDTSKSRSLVGGIGKAFEDIWGTGIDTNIDLGLGYSETDDEYGSGTGSPVVHVGVNAEKQILENLKSKAGYSLDYGLSSEDNSTSIFSISLKYCLGNKCRFELGPSIKRTIVKSGNTKSEDDSANVEASYKW